MKLTELNTKIEEIAKTYGFDEKAIKYLKDDVLACLTFRCHKKQLREGLPMRVCRKRIGKEKRHVAELVCASIMSKEGFEPSPMQFYRWRLLCDLWHFFCFRFDDRLYVEVM